MCQVFFLFLNEKFIILYILVDDNLALMHTWMDILGFCELRFDGV